jgi:hypothetical protein
LGQFFFDILIDLLEDSLEADNGHPLKERGVKPELDGKPILYLKGNGWRRMAERNIQHVATGVVAIIEVFELKLLD